MTDMLDLMTKTLAGIAPATPAPLVTFYDVATSERTELSGITMANWVAKVSNFLVDDLDVEVGTRIRLGLPAHWLRFVWLLSSWNVGAVVADHDCEIGLTGPDLDATEGIKLATALAPFGMRFPTAPEGFLDIGIEVLGHPDHYEPFFGPTQTDLAWDLAGKSSTHESALATLTSAANRLLLADTDILTDARALIAAISSGGSLVSVRNANRDAIETIARQENAEIYHVGDEIA